MLKENINTITHDTISPLEAISLHLGQIEKGFIDQKQKISLQIINNEIERLSHTLRTILNFTKSERGMLSLNRIQKDICELIRDVVSLYELEAKHKNVKLEFDCPGKTITFDLDEELIKNAISNLVKNAIQAIVDKIPDEKRKIIVKS